MKMKLYQYIQSIESTEKLQWLNKLEISIAAQCECIPRHWQRFLRPPLFEGGTNLPPPLPSNKKDDIEIAASAPDYCQH